jgi:hypothetical protein
MKLAFQGFLAKNGLTENDLSTSLRKGANEIHKLVKAVADAEEKLKDENLTVKKREELAKDVADGNELIPEMDKALTGKIKKWLPNRQANQDTGRKLAEARAAKATGTGTPAAQPPVAAPAPVPDPPAPTPAASAGAPAKKGEPAIPIKDDKKGSGSWWKWGLGLVATVVLSAVGVQMYRSYTDKGL